MAMKRQEKGHDLRAEDCQNSRWGANSRLRWVDHSYPAGLFGVAGVGPRPWPVRVVRHRRRLAVNANLVQRKIGVRNSGHEHNENSLHVVLVVLMSAVSYPNLPLNQRT